jgi:hypothetical protein
MERGQTDLVETRPMQVVPCNLPVASLVHQNRQASAKTETIHGERYGLFQMVPSITPSSAKPVRRPSVK